MGSWAGTRALARGEGVRLSGMPRESGSHQAPRANNGGQASRVCARALRERESRTMSSTPRHGALESTIARVGVSESPLLRDPAGAVVACPAPVRELTRAITLNQTLTPSRAFRASTEASARPPAQRRCAPGARQDGVDSGAASFLTHLSASA